MQASGHTLGSIVGDLDIIGNGLLAGNDMIYTNVSG